MSAEWPSISLSPGAITVAPFIDAGSIYQAYDHLRYVATNNAGLVEISNRSYQIVQVWKRENQGQLELVPLWEPDVALTTLNGIRATCDPGYGTNLTKMVPYGEGKVSRPDRMPKYRRVNNISKGSLILTPVPVEDQWCKEGTMWYGPSPKWVFSYTYYYDAGDYPYDGTGFKMLGKKMVLLDKFKNKTKSEALAWKSASTNSTSSTSTLTPTVSPYSNHPLNTATDAENIVNSAMRILGANEDWLLYDGMQSRFSPDGMPLLSDADLRNLIYDILGGAGWSNAQIQAFLDAKNAVLDPVKGSANGDGANTAAPIGSKPVPEVAPTPAVTKVVVRAPFGYAKPPTKPRSTKPMIVQTYTSYFKDTSTASGYKAVSGQAQYVFPLVPNRIRYSGLGSEWATIQRQGNIPLVEWSSYKLLRVDLDFVIAGESIVNGQPVGMNGLVVSVDQDIRKLRKMAQRQAPVSIFNMDDLLEIQMQRAKVTGRALQFVIAEFDVTATYRSNEASAITRAECTLTLQEIPIEEVTLVKFPPPELSEPLATPKSGTGTDPIADPRGSDAWTVIANLNDAYSN